MLLPCRHVFVARRQLSLPVFDRELVGGRWLLSSLCTGNPVSSYHVFMASPETFAANDNRRCLSAKDKYSKAMALLTPLAVLLSESGQAQFNSMYDLLYRVREKFESGLHKSIANKYLIRTLQYTYVISIDMYLQLFPLLVLCSHLVLY